MCLHQPEDEVTENELVRYRVSFRHNATELFSKVPDNQQGLMPASILDAILAKLIHLWFSYQDLRPFSEIGKTTDSYQALGTSSLAQIGPRSFVNPDVSNSSSSMKEDNDKPSVLCFLRKLDHKFGWKTGVHMRCFINMYKWKAH